MVVVEMMTDSATVESELNAVVEQLENLDDEAGVHLIEARLAEDRNDFSAQTVAEDTLADVMEKQRDLSEWKRALEGQRTRLQRLIKETREARQLTHFRESVAPALPCPVTRPPWTPWRKT